MLVCFNEKREIVWYNTIVDEKESQQFLSQDVVWITNDIPERKNVEGVQFILFIDEENNLYWEEDKPETKVLSKESLAIMNMSLNMEYLVMLTENKI